MTGPEDQSERERFADERERLADTRERLADERERLADDREEVADKRELLTGGDEQGSTDGLLRGSRLRLAQSEDNLESAKQALARSESLLARRRVAADDEDNTTRQQELVIVREMFESLTGDEDRPPAPGLTG